MTNKKWNIFPNISLIAYYNSIGNYISLNDISESNFHLLMKNKHNYPTKYSIYQHELQHWLDHVSTIWGIKRTAKIFNSFHIIFFGKEHELYHLQELNLDLKKDSLKIYYSENYPCDSDELSQNWTYRFSTGLKFDNKGHIDNTKSIYFVQIISQLGNKISRVPLSVSSLLETTAMNSEIKNYLRYIDSLNDDEKNIELILYRKKIKKLMYDQKLTEYSVTVLITCNILEIDDIFVGYHIASSIATLCLNLPTKLFKSIALPIHHTAGGILERVINLINENDRGYLFYCLLINYFHDYGKYNILTFSIEKILKATGLPKMIEIENEIQEEIQEISINMNVNKNIFNNLFSRIISLRADVKNNRGIANEKKYDCEIDINKLHTKPYIICSDTYVDCDEVNIENAILDIHSKDTFKREQWWKVHEFCSKKLDHFTDICGI